MDIKDFMKLEKSVGKVARNQRNIKTYKSEFYTINSLLGNDWARFFYLLGGREAGKSYSAMRWGTNRKLKLREKMKFYWFRLTETQQKALLANNAGDLIDPDLKSKYNLKTMTKGNIVYTYKEVIEVNEKTGKETVRKDDIQEFCRVMACSTFYNDKGRGYFDKDFDGEYLVILDEMNREQNEKNSFDIVYAFVNQLENVLRSTKTRVKIIMIGNTLEEASDLLSALNFIPDGFGRYKLKRKEAVVDYIMPNEKYKARREKASANMLMPNASTFTNEIELDKSLIVSKRLRKQAQYIIKFNKSKDTWFTVWNDSIVSPYNNETCTQVIAMRRYLDEFYLLENANSVIERFDARSYRFTTLAGFKQFQKQMRLLKK